MPARLLLVEDDPAIAEPLLRSLGREGYDAVHAGTRAAALAEVERHVPDLLLLDLGLPDGDGIDVCQKVKAAHAELPVIMLTARAEEVDAVVGLDAGADDYVAKPFRLAELLARVRARLRQRRTSDVLDANGVVLDVGAHRCTVDGEPCELTPKEFELLALLMSRAGTVVSREDIMAEVWDQTWVGSSRTLDMHVSLLRRKLHDDPATPRRIATVRGVGFRFEAG